VLSGLSKWQLQVLRSAVQDDELVVPEGRLLRDQRGLLRGHPHAGVPGLGVHVPREGMPGEGGGGKKGKRIKTGART